MNLDFESNNKEVVSIPLSQGLVMEEIKWPALSSGRMEEPLVYTLAVGLASLTQWCLDLRPASGKEAEQESVTAGLSLLHTQTRLPQGHLVVGTVPLVLPIYWPMFYWPSPWFSASQLPSLATLLPTAAPCPACFR